MARNSVKYLAKIGFEVVLKPATETQVAAALNLGHSFYANSFVADGTFNEHRIVIFELGIHNTDHFQNYIKYYDPNIGIQTMYNFFYENNGEYKKGYYNYSYPGTSLIITSRTQP